MAEAQAAAHGRGIIHRDLKPGNIMLTKTGAKSWTLGWQNRLEMKRSPRATL